MPRGANAPGARFGEFVNKVPTLATRSRGEGLMEVIHRRCSGLDVHKETVVACVRLVLDGKITREVRSFETTTAGLLLLLAWLTEMGCTHVAMESTGVYWNRSGTFSATAIWSWFWRMPLTSKMFRVVRPMSVMRLGSPICWPTGLIRSSFVPEREIQELRELMRTRK